MKMVGQHALGHDNNFTPIRFLAANAVILAHSYHLTDNTPDFITPVTGIGLDSLAMGTFALATGTSSPVTSQGSL